MNSRLRPCLIISVQSHLLPVPPLLPTIPFVQNQVFYLADYFLYYLVSLELTNLMIVSAFDIDHGLCLCLFGGPSTTRSKSSTVELLLTASRLAPVLPPRSRHPPTALPTSTPLMSTEWTADSNAALCLSLGKCHWH